MLPFNAVSFTVIMSGFSALAISHKLSFFEVYPSIFVWSIFKFTVLIGFFLFALLLGLRFFTVVNFSTLVDLGSDSFSGSENPHRTNVHTNTQF